MVSTPSVNTIFFKLSAQPKNRWLIPFPMRRLNRGDVFIMSPFIVIVSALIFRGQNNNVASVVSVASCTRIPSIDVNEAFPSVTSIVSNPSLYQNVSLADTNPWKVVGRINFFRILL